MADPLSPFLPAAGALPGMETFESLRSQWDSFLEQPGARTALMQFGVNMLQPPSFGDTPMSQLGRAVGAAGEATTRQGILDVKERESEAKTDLAEARAGAATARAGEAGARADAAASRLGLQRERLELDRQRYGLQNSYNLLTQYNKYRLAIDKQNADARKAWDNNVTKKPGEAPPAPIVPLGQAEWMAQMSASGGTLVQPPGGPRPAPSGGIVDVSTPDEANALPAGTRYRTPDGQVYRR